MIREPIDSAAMTTAERRWRETWTLVGCEAPAELLVDLLARYGEPGRHYHDLGHVLDCLEKAVGVREVQGDPAAVELALWYHDAVHDPLRSGDEERSAELARGALAGRIDEARVAKVSSLILDTRHREPPGSPDGAVVADVDLSILGAEPEAFDAFQRAIRREYALVPGFLFRRRRAKLLRSFLDRDRIFTTEPFHQRYEARARENLRRALGEPGPS